tara:strand:- start:1030 stop:2187 length:1158 start_codon:yes stop_codon:yes gene_type:complete
MQNIYDLVVIGGGISSATFIANILKQGFNGRIAVVEAGRGLGGRCSTRYRYKDKKFSLNHGCPNFNIKSHKKNPLLDNFIEELLDKKLIKSLDNLFFELDENFKFQKNYDNEFYFGNVYTSTTNMSKLVENIIHLYNSKDQIDFYFETLIVKLNFKSELWSLFSNKNKKIIGKLLVCSSNLLLHERSLDILNVREIPLKEAINNKNSNKIDEIINLTNEQQYIKRINFLIFTKKDFNLEGIFNKEIIHFIFNQNAQKNIGFERIIFQKQFDNSLGIVIHTRGMESLINKYERKGKKILYQYILNKLDNFLIKNQITIKNLLLDDISRMNWRASQPIGEAVPERLQLCEDYKIGFCGDWIQLEGYSSVMGAILSGIKLSNKFIQYY